MKKIIETIKNWLWKKTEPFTTQDQINFDLERFQIKFCQYCGAPFHLNTPTQVYCSKLCSKRYWKLKKKSKRMSERLNGHEEV